MRPVKNGGVFERVAPVVDFPAAEARVREFWRERDIFARSLALRSSGPRFVFYEGPPTANGLPHNPELMEVFAPLVRSRRQPLIRALERAVARGEIPADTDLSLAADLIVGPITVRIFFSRAKPTPKLVPAIVQLALDGIRGTAERRKEADERRPTRSEAKPSEGRSPSASD